MAHKYAGLHGAEILRTKKGSVRFAPLPIGSPIWSEFEAMIWEQIEDGSEAAGVIRGLTDDYENFQSIGIPGFAAKREDLLSSQPTSW